MNKGTMWIALCVVVGLFMVLTGISPAQEQNTNTSNMNANMQGNMNGNSNTHDKHTGHSNANSNMAHDMNANMQGNMNGGGTMAANLNSMDRKFMMTAAAGGMAEVEMARMALDRAASDGVKQFAQHMIDDHTKANQELMQVAATKGVTLPAGPDAKHQALMAKMMKLSGAAFDREYIKNAGVKDHQEMEKLFMDEGRKGADADTKAFAAKTLPAVQEHLRMAREMSSNMMNTNSNSNMNSNSNNSNR